MPRFSIPHEPVYPRPHELPHGSIDDPATGGSPGHGSGGGPAPVSMTSAGRGFPTRAAGWGRNQLRAPSHDDSPFKQATIPGQYKAYYIASRKTSTAGRAEALYELDPITGIYTPTGLTAHSDRSGHWVLDNPASASATSTSTSAQPGSSGASSSRAVGEPKAGVPHELEDLLGKPEVRRPKSGFSYRGRPIFHTFHGETLPERKGPYNPRPNVDADNRQFVFDRIKPLLEPRGYRSRLGNNHLSTLRMEVTNARTGFQFFIYVKLTSKGKVTLPADAPKDQPYLLAVVRIKGDNGQLQTLQVIPITHEAQGAAQSHQSSPPDQSAQPDQSARIWRGWD